MPRPSPKTAVLICLWLTCIFVPTPSSAHVEYRPFSSNRYLELSTEGQDLFLSWWLTVGDLPAFRLRQHFDANADGSLSQKEVLALKAHLVALFDAGLRLELDGKKQTPQRGPVELDLMSDQVEMYAPLRLRLLARLPCPAGNHSLRLADQSRPEEAGQSELSIQGAKDLQILQAFLERGGPEPALRQNDPTGFIQRLVWENGETGALLALRFSWKPKHKETGHGHAHATPLEDETQSLKTALANRNLSLSGLLLALLLAFGLGTLHALSPGHGKTLVAAYLVGSRGRMRHAVLLGAVVTVTHVTSVFILGAVALWASEYVLPEKLTPWMSLAAGILVLLMGGWMLQSRLRHKDHHHDHHHDHKHDHEHGHDHPKETPRLGELFGLGISGGLVPCPSATVVLLLAIYLGRIAMGLGLLVAFSAGLAFTLVIIGILVVQGRKLLERFSKGARVQQLSRWLPVLSALIVTSLGLWLTLGALFHTMK